MGSGGFALFGGPGCLTRPWAAARPRAVRAASFARRVDSLSGQAPPLLSNFARNSPASTSNIEFMSLELQRFQAIFKSDRGKLCAKCVWGVCVGSLSGQAPPPPTGTAARPRCHPRHSNFACNSPAACSNIEFASLELQRFLGLLKFGPIELHAKFVWRWPCEPVLALPTGRSPAPLSPTGTAARPRCRPRHSNFACNSPAACSNIEFASLELQRFLGLLKFGPIELHAKFVWRWSCQPMMALPTGSLHRVQSLWALRCLSH